MWFNNVLVFSYELPQDTKLSDALAEHALKPCPPHARFIYGWLPMIEESFVHESTGALMISLGKEERILPRGVLKKLTDDRIEDMEAQRGRSLSRAEKGKISEDLEFELLPKAFCLQKRLDALFDPISKRLFINTGSASQAAQLTGLLRKSVPGISLMPLEIEQSLSPILTGWLQNMTTLPAAFTIAETCLLFSLDDEKKRLACKGYDLSAQEIGNLLEEGLAVSELSLVWRERIALTLTQDFSLKRIKCTDYLVDEFQGLNELDDEAQQKDASLTLLCGELRALIDDLLEAIKTPQQDLPVEATHQQAAAIM